MVLKLVLDPIGLEKDVLQKQEKIQHAKGQLTNTMDAVDYMEVSQPGQKLQRVLNVSLMQILSMVL